MFLPLPQFSNYEIDENGAARNIKTGKLIKPYCHPHFTDGYFTYQFWRNNKPFKMTRARAILLAHRPIPLELWAGFEAAHQNGKRTDDRLDNLAWRTHTENMSEIGKDFITGDLF